jgi:hypothetical protein
VCRAAAVALVVLLLSNEGPSLVLTTWGMPRDPRFMVELFENGRLRVTREAPPFSDDGQLTKKVVERRISRSKAQKILKLAADARDFAAGCGGVPDGTHASMVLQKDAKELRRDCHGADVWPNGAHARAMLNAINAVVPGEMRVY